MLFIYYKQVKDVNIYWFGGLYFFIFIIALIYKQARLIYYVLVIIYFFYSQNLAKIDALITKKEKPNFNIILNDNSFALKENKASHKDYFIGKITNYVFIYSDSLKKVRVIPVSQIKEIQFPLK